MGYDREDNKGFRPRHDGGGYRQRNNGGGGGGGSGGGPSRYRDNRRQGNNNGGYQQRRPYDRPPAAAENKEEDIETRLKSLIIKIGDKISPDLKVNLQKMKNILDNDYSKYPETVQNTLTACVTELPAKAPVYGALIGLLNVSSHDIVSKLLTEFNKHLEKCIAESDWFKLKQFLRFYGELVNANVILPTMYCNLLNDILTPLDESNQLRERLDTVVYVILATLPWCGKELSDRNGTELNQILKKIEIYMQRRGNVPVLDILKQYTHTDNNNDSQDVLAHIWVLIQDLQSNKSWNLPLIPKPYEWFDSEFTSTLQHNLPRFMLPGHDNKIDYVLPLATTQLLVGEQGVSLPDPNSIEYFILQEMISDTMSLFEVNRKDCARYLLGIANSFDHELFKSDAASAVALKQEDGVEAMQQDEDDKWCLSDLLVEAIFSQMLRLPTPPVRQVFYACVLIELCRSETATFPMALGKGVKILFNRLPQMDTECVYRLWCWFSHHLSNFGFQWDWKAWDQVLTKDPNDVQVCFIRETLEKETRLSYYEHIKSILPAEFHTLVPDAAPTPDFAFKDPSDPLHTKAKLIVESLRNKKSTDEIRAMLDQYRLELATPEGGSITDVNEQTKHIRFVFVQCLLVVGSKSFSHILNVVERYLDVLRGVNSTAEARLHTVQIVASFWKNNSQFLCILLDKLLNYRVVDPTSVIAWVFEAEQLQHVSRSFLWEILSNTLSKVVSRVAQVKSRLVDFQATHQANNAKRAETEMTDMAKAERKQEEDTVKIVENSLETVSRDQKEVFILVYQKFTQVLTELIKTNPDPESNLTYKWVYGWFKEFLRVYYKECSGFMTTLETLVFTSDLDSRINNIFAQVKTLKQESETLV